MDAQFGAADSSLPAGLVPVRSRTTSAPRWIGGLLAVLVLLLGLGIAAYGTGYSYRPVADLGEAASLDVPRDPSTVKQLQSRLDKRQKQLQALLDRKAPHGIYIVIDQTQNRLYLMKDDQVVHEAVCSAGSGMILKENGGGKRTWMFDTPRGVFRVQNKLEDPIWKKPDWAFVEEGKPIPKNDADRFDPAALGEFALYFGNGYMIHGTLYERLLGRSVTHGCIRLGREDLREVFHAAPIGTPIYIF
jgi:L,D-transpeptidase ErfK/SrfK